MKPLVPLADSLAEDAGDDFAPVKQRPSGWSQPRKWAERYYNPKRWNVIERGGHFAPMEQPEVLVDDIRAFFRTLRSGG